MKYRYRIEIMSIMGSLMVNIIYWFNNMLWLQKFINSKIGGSGDKWLEECMN